MLKTTNPLRLRLRLTGFYSAGVSVTHIICPTAPPRTASTTSSPSETAQAQASATPDKDNAPEPGGGLSTGAKIGTGVGVAIGGALIIAIGVALFFLRGRSRTAKDQSRGDPFVTEMKPISVDRSGMASESERDLARTPERAPSEFEGRETSIREMN
ncbi:hypothetical protein FGG08_002289 [Glutinoglossum americanum]|uniref:Uncharacterized protein n=1 Tax=Glutinoglossum americanum TaxID=1670608 RepID=A0A9P8I0I5_9PEZI|nr:hypothetical protein FGG08_002289 [Glutinoglossum americanum]